VGHCLCSKRGALGNLRGVIVMDMVGFACYSRLPRYPAGLPIIPPTNRGLSGSSWRFKLATTRSFPPVRSIGSATSPDAAGSSQRMLIPDTLRRSCAVLVPGVGAVLLTDTADLRTPHYHQPSDTQQPSTFRSSPEPPSCFKCYPSC